MKNFEDELRSSLRRKEPSPEFARRVLAGIEARRSPATRWGHSLISFFRLPRIRWAAGVALVAVVSTLGVIRYRQIQRERAEGKIARQHVMLALNIASAKLNVVLKQVEQLDRRRPSPRAREKYSKPTERL